ncbi:MAG: histidine phosphatase family protein [Chloroflexota bacterium]
MHLYLIRHGESFVNLPDWEGGIVDTPLTHLGHQQASQLAAWLPKTVPAIDALYTSTLQRARETGAHLSEVYDCTLQENDRIREIGTNRLDHIPWPNDDLPPGFTIWGTEKPFIPVTALTEDQDESWMHFKLRVGAFIETLIDLHREHTVLVVCHGGVIDAVFDHIFNVGPWRRCEVWHDNTGVTYFEHIDLPKRETWRLHYTNRREHLEP